MQRPKIVIIHPNSLCCLAMRSILTDIAPFVSMFREVDIVSYNTMKEAMSDNPHIAVHYFVAADIVKDNMEFFAPQCRRCIVLSEGEQNALPEFRNLNLHRSERELLKGFLMMLNSAHTAHGMPPQVQHPTEELLSQREKDVLALLVKGLINKEIADRLNISTPTVIFHRRNISEKIGSKSIGRLTIYAVMNGIIDVREL